MVISLKFYNACSQHETQRTNKQLNFIIGYSFLKMMYTMCFDLVCTSNSYFITKLKFMSLKCDC
jgi:hypothetical protein